MRDYVVVVIERIQKLQQRIVIVQEQYSCCFEIDPIGFGQVYHEKEFFKVR